jgi:hypothetical protein
MDRAAPDHAKHKDTGRRRDIGSLRDRQHRPHPARRVGRDHLRSREDSGTQYRSAIFYKDAEQKRNAEAYIKQLSAAQVFNRPIATEVTALKRFFPAEEYHQQFVKRNPD